MMILGGRSLQLVYALLILLHMQTSVGFDSTTGDYEIRCIESERQALLAFKQSLVDEYGTLSTWGSEEEKKECCKWEGVQCSNTTRHVTVLELSLLRGGSLSNQLANLTSLQHLSLGYNNFNSVKNLEWLSCLSYLQFLDMSGIDLSRVTNSLQQAINKLPSLTHLVLRSTNLTASTFQSSLKFNNSPVSLIPENLGHITNLEFLDLSYNQFEGGIPKSFGNLCKLTHLVLSNNKLDGMLPEIMGNISGCLQVSLGSLILDGNKIKGPFPDMIKNFSSLVELTLSNNQLSGTLPKSIGLLSKLGSLNISSNSFNGVITEAYFLTLSKLRFLDMSFNPLNINFSRDWIPPFQLNYLGLQSCKLGPKFPSWLKTQRELSILDISRNEISDSIPEWFWNLTSTAFQIDLSSNQIHGVLPNLSTTKFPDSFSLGIDLSKNRLEGLFPVFPTNVTYINLSENRFSGSISSLCTINAEILQFVDVSSNQLSGELPDCMARWTSLVILNLANNHLLGKIPSFIGSLSLLGSLGLQNNSLSGEIPWSLGNCSALQFLDLSYNSFSGIIPTWIGERLSSLAFLLLRSNNFSGDIPLQLCWLTNIILLDLSNNNLYGSIPRCIQNLTALAQKESSTRYYLFNNSNIVGTAWYSGTYADKASVMWKGMERDYGNGNLKNLRIVDLSGNKLTGEIPVQISVLLELVQLNLSRNQLTGRIPSDIGQMRQLESLDLSQNQLSGHLPGSMSQLNFLSTLNLSYNNFSGRIPLSTQIQSFNASAFVGNPSLCGLPLTPTCAGDEKPKSKPTDSGGKDNQEDRSEFWKSFTLGMELGAAIGFVGVLAVKLDHPWKHLCFLLFNNVRVRLSNLKDCLYLLVAAVGFVVREHVSRWGRKLKLFEPSVSS
ncbi:hypothetical protein SLEP1_g39165 [Rubroshorea leprosula]|uniref:Leucine-rich repeat-containing N-terminal plant-type domain-containing protein n=1 Tax=Rubroshorea leprosula TaxID=152421 RepID=A0AAV5KZR7_9ROSI|nr:hypothetical protein SLEP1_g39165 [Rubroshorea leprosula]